MKLLGSIQNKLTKAKNNDDLPHLGIKEVALVHCNIVNNDYQQDSRVFYTFVTNKPFRSLLEISSISFFKTFNSKFQDIRVWFINQNSQLLETEDRINLILAIR